jgi:hypothetical protein
MQVLAFIDITLAQLMTEVSIGANFGIIMRVAGFISGFWLLNRLI